MCKMRNGYFKEPFLGKNNLKKPMQVIAEQVLGFEEESPHG